MVITLDLLAKHPSPFHQIKLTFHFTTNVIIKLIILLPLEYWITFHLMLSYLIADNKNILMSNRMRWRSRSWNSFCRRCTDYRRCIHKCRHPFEWPDRFQSWTWPDPCRCTIDGPKKGRDKLFNRKYKTLVVECLTCM